jgi:glucokinase
MSLTEYEGYVGIDIGGQSIKIGAVRNGELVTRDIETPPDYADARAQMLAAATELVGGKPKGLGIGTPGPIDWRTGFLYWTPNIPWKNVSYPELGEALGCPVHVDNDANVAGLAEAVLGAGKDYRIVAGFTLGTGIGYFVVMDGLIYHGKLDVEGGHQVLNPEGPLCGCGARGCLEAYASAFWAEIAGYLAWGITNVTTLVCPEVFVLAGGMIQRGETLFAPLREKLAQMLKIVPPPPVKPAELGHRAGVYGAIVLAKRGHKAE